MRRFLFISASFVIHFDILKVLLLSQGWGSGVNRYTVTESDILIYILVLCSVVIGVGVGDRTLLSLYLTCLVSFDLIIGVKKTGFEVQFVNDD